MKTLFMSLILILSTNTQAQQIEKGMMMVNCQNDLTTGTEDAYTAIVYSYKNGDGLLVLTNQERVILTAKVKTGGNDGTFVVAFGKNLSFIVDQEDAARGRVTYRSSETGKEKTIYFEKFECSGVPVGWPYPGSYKG